MIELEPRIIFGTSGDVKAALTRSASSRAVNTSFVERPNGADRNRNARKTRRSYGFSKDCSVRRVITFFTGDDGRRRWRRTWPTTSGRSRSG